MSAVMTLRVLASLVAWPLVAWPAPCSAEVASFDCAKAASAVENAICREPSLGAKDIRLAAYYQILQDAAPAWSGMAYREFRDAELQRQADWIAKERDPCGGDLACLQQAYDKRIAELRATIAKNLGLTYGRMCDPN
ncbi:MAG: lysozyme inhibitor LprI family protein [Methylocella sp.]